MMIVLFQSTQGLRVVERDIATALRDDCHDVLVPDLRRQDGYAVIPDHVAVGVRASLHVAVGDRFAPANAIATWRTAAAAQGVDAEVHRCPDVGHFFTDPASADYDKAAVQTLSQRVRTFLRNAA
ncbi:MAG: dienelactone hydrolase family protein [Thermoleophilaceae bacterium]